MSQKYFLEFFEQSKVDMGAIISANFGGFSDIFGDFCVPQTITLKTVNKLIYACHYLAAKSTSIQLCGIRYDG